MWSSEFYDLDLLGHGGWIKKSNYSPNGGEKLWFIMVESEKNNTLNKAKIWKITLITLKQITLSKNNNPPPPPPFGGQKI